MFGYIRPLREDLRMREYDFYRAAYCGLCHALGKRCGFAARFLVSYDMTFFYLLLQSPEPAPATQMHHCPAHARRRSCVQESPAMALAADYSVLLYVWKLRDEVSDESLPRRMAARAALLFLKPSYRKAAARHPQADAMIARQLQKLAQLEAKQSDVIDAPADAFAALLSGLAPESPQLRPMQQLLYHVGRYIYLVDALDDLSQDCAKNRYNPLRYRFGVTDGVLDEADKSYLRATVQSSIGMACAALELLQTCSSGSLLENIVYQGMPAALEAVAAGSFHNSGKI